MPERGTNVCPTCRMGFAAIEIEPPDRPFLQELPTVLSAPRMVDLTCVNGHRWRASEYRITREYGREFSGLLSLDGPS